MSRKFIILVLMMISFYSNLMQGVAFGLTSLTPSLIVTESYHSNVRGRSIDEDVEDDYETSVNPRLSLLDERETLVVDCLYSLNNRSYLNESDLNYTAHNFNITVNKQFSRKAALSFFDDYRYTKDSREALDSQVELGRGSVIRNRAELIFSYTFSERISSETGVSQTVTHYDDEQFFDEKADRFTFTLRDRVSPYLTLNFHYGFTLFGYEDDTDLPDRESHDVRVGLTRLMARSLTFTVNVGASYTPDLESDYDWIANAEIEKTWRRASLFLSYTREVTNSSGLIADVIINNRGSVELTYHFGRRISLSLLGAYSKNRSQDSDVINNYSYSYEARGTWRYSELTAFNIGFRRYEQKSEDAFTNDVERDVAYLSVELTPDGWRF